MTATARAAGTTHVGFGIALLVLGLARALTSALPGGIVFLVASIVPVVVVVTVLVVRSAERLMPWLLVAVALTAATAHNVVWLVEVQLTGDPLPSGAFYDGSLLLAHGGLLVAAILLVAPVARDDGGAIVDAAIVAVSAAGLLWTLLLEPALEAQTADDATRVQTLVTVLLVCGTTGAVARASLTARDARPTFVYLLVAALCMLVATLLDAGTLVSATSAETSLKDIIWIGAYLALAAAAAHPARSALGAPGRRLARPLTLPHMLVLGFAICSNLLLAGVLELTGTGSDPALLIIGSLAVVPLFLLRVWQIAGLYEHAQKDLLRQARHDDLTGLPNRRAAIAHLEDTVGRIADGELTGARVCFLDLDRFKTVNDEYGHRVGDLLLRAVTVRLCAAVRADDFVARLSGDEFVVVLLSDSPGLAASTIERIRAAFVEPVDIGGIAIPVAASVGSAAVRRGDGVTAEQLLSLADAQMYLDKRRDRTAV